MRYLLLWVESLIFHCHITGNCVMMDYILSIFQRVFLAYVYRFFSVETHHACNLHQLNKVFEYPCLKLMFYFTFKLICIITRLYRLHMVQPSSIIRQSDKYWYGITHGNHFGNNIHQTLNSQYIAHMFLFIICYALLIMCVLKTMTLW